jgi:hypothetical protein
MKVSTQLGILAASAVASLIGTAAFAAEDGSMAEDKACYRPHCGKSVTGHEGKCGGTKIEALSDQAGCEAAGGAWATAADAEKLKDNKS